MYMYQVAFILAFVSDSIILRETVGWYTSLVGKKGTLKVILRVLKSEVQNCNIKKNQL